MILPPHITGLVPISSGDKTIILNKNESVFIPVGEKHSVENSGQVALKIIEVQTVSYLGEDDIVSLEDASALRILIMIYVLNPT